MDLLEYLRTFTRRWLVIAATVVVAMTAAWFTTETIAPLEPSPPTYQASTLLLSGGDTGIDANLNTLAVLATVHRVANRAADELGFDGDPLILRQRVQATPDVETGILTITGFAPKPGGAEETSEAFTAALIDFLRDRRRNQHESRIASLESKIEDAESAGDPNELETLRAELAVAESESAQPIGLTVVQPAVAELVPTTGFSPPDSPTVRLSVAAVIGLLAGAGIALILERLDTKIRSSEQATERFGYPVLAEIPSIPRDQRKGVVTADHPTSRGADAFRLLGAGAHVAVRPRAEDEDANGNDGRIVLVTSSGPAEGKSTVVANLAAVLAEEGKKVIVFSADLRRPTLHDVLDADREPGLVQAAGEQEPRIRRYKQWTRLDRVLFVPSGGSTERPGEILASPSVATLIHEARSAADWVILDTAPILVAGESAPLIDTADLVLVVARCGTTSNPVAERTRDTLHRLGADSTWVVLNASRERSAPTGYRRYHISAERAKVRDARTKGFPR